jgi:hypothetical protein
VNHDGDNASDEESDSDDNLNWKWHLMSVPSSFNS